MNSATRQSNELSAPLESQGQTPVCDSHEGEREQRLDEIIAGYLDDVARGSPPDRAALIARHPDLAAELQAFFTDQDRFNRLASPLREISQETPRSGTDAVGAQRQTPALSDTQSFATKPPSGTGDTPPLSLAFEGGATGVPPDSAATVADGASDASDPSRQSASLPRITGYEILEEIGRGGMGVVYKARQLSLKRLVAVKMMRGGAGVRPHELARFKTEAEHVAKVHHPNVVQIHEVGEKDGVPFFCLELIQGGSLNKRLDGAPLPPRTSAKLVITLARAMHYAHECGIVHRDLKPANILLAGAPDAPIDQCVPKVSDFGLAKSLDSEIGGTRTGEIMGTPSYMSPEQASGRSKEVGPAADIYALGTILYELLTGRPPFKAATALDTVLQVLHDDPLPPSRLLKSCPRDLETICLKCLEKEPPRRYGSALTLAEDLDRFLESKTIHARPASVRERTVKWMWRNPGKAAAVLAVALVVVSIFGFNIYLGKEVRIARAEATETERVSSLREDCGSLLTDAEAALQPANLQDKDLKKAEEFAAKAKKKSEDERKLDDFRVRADRLLDEIQRLRLARANYEKFLQGFEDALIELNPTSFTGANAPDSLAKIQRIAQQALELFGVSGDAAAGPVFDECYGAAEKQHITFTCFEMLLHLAETHARLGDKRNGVSKALAILDRAALLVPSTQIYHHRRARYCTLLGDEAGARLERAKKSKLRPANVLDRYLMGLELLDEGKRLEGRGYLELALQEQPDHFWAQFFLGVDHLRNPKASHEQANAHLTVCIGRRPEFIWSYVIRGFIRGERGEFEAAQADFDKAWKLKPNASAEYALRVNRGAILARRLRFGDALVEFDKAVPLQPHQFQAHVNMAAVYYEQQKWDEFAHHLLMLHAGPLHGLRTLALTEVKQQKLAEAVRHLDHAIEFKPTLAPLYRERAQVHLSRNDPTKALRDFECALALEPHAGTAHVDHLECAAIHFQERRYDAAFAACKKAFALQPNFAGAYRLAAKSCFELRKHNEALFYSDLYLVFGRPQVEIFELRVFALRELRNIAAIPDEYGRALAIKPNDVALLMARGWAYILNDAPKVALRDFQKAVNLNPREAYAYTGLGEAIVRLGGPVEGARHAAKAIELGPADSRTYCAAARVFALAGAALESAPRPLDRSVRDKSEEYFKEAVKCLSQGLDLCASDMHRLDFWQTKVRPESERPGTPLYRLHDNDQFRTMAAHYDRLAAALAQKQKLGGTP